VDNLALETQSQENVILIRFPC